MPSDISSLHSVYSKKPSKFSKILASLLRIPEIDCQKFSDFQEFLDDNRYVKLNNPELVEKIRKNKKKIKHILFKRWEEERKKEEMQEKEFYARVHLENYQRIEEEITERNQHLIYLKFVYNNITELEEEVEYYKKDFHNSQTIDKYVKKNHNVHYPIRFSNMKLAYDNMFNNYQFGWANHKLESFSSINTNLKFARKIFSKFERWILFSDQSNRIQRTFWKFNQWPKERPQISPPDEVQQIDQG